MLSHLCNETGCNNYDCSICMFNETVAKANVVTPNVVTPIKTEYNKAPHINDCNEYKCDECPFEAYCR